MKQILILSMLFSSIHLNAQTDSSQFESDSIEIKTVQLPDSTAIGAPDGKLVSKQIDSSGGEIISDDGRVELIFPPGALTAPTSISIQPIVNLIPNGNGKGYRFEPSGIHFAKPVEIIFHYSESEDEACPALFHFMGIQDASGKWQYGDYEDWDSTTKTLKGYLAHFTQMIDGSEVDLYPQDVDVKVGTSNEFHLSKVRLPEKQSNQSGDETDILPPMPALPDVDVGERQSHWYVNRVEGGNSRSGTIGIEQDEKVSALYAAPMLLPGDRSTKVALALTIFTKVDPTRGRYGSKGKQASFAKTKRVVLGSFSSVVHLYDLYKVLVTMDFGAGTHLEILDKSSFELKIKDNKVAIDDQDNMVAQVTATGDCKPEVINKATCEGLITVQGIKSATVSPSGSGKYARVDLQFIPAKANMPQFEFPPCGINMVWATSPLFHSPFAFPVRITFDLSKELPPLSLGKKDGAPVKKIDPNDITAVITRE